jgi:LuxR family maltose regulon positive regulatory protein
MTSGSATAKWTEGSGVARLNPRLSPPRPLAFAIQRQLLVTMVLDGLEKQIVLVHAPAGYGKSELLSASYQALIVDPELAVRRLGIVRCGWISLSRAHMGDGVFVADLADTLGLPGVADGLEFLLQQVGLRPGNFVLFIDNADMIESSELRNLFDTVFRYAPENLRIVCALRKRPTMPLARFRVRGLVSEIVARHLAFTHSELRAAMGKGLTQNQLASLFRVTQGWPALVHLAAGPLVDAGPDEIATVCAGEHPVFFEYVDQVVLADVDASVRGWLETCAIVDEFSLDLAAALAAESSHAELLQTIDDLDSAVARSGRGRNWYIFHPIVRTSLLARLSERLGSGISRLHSAAGAWFASNGMLEQAVSHASRAGDFEFATETIRQSGGVEVFLRVGYSVLVRLIDSLPAEIVRNSPTLMLCQALVLAKRGRFAAAHEYLDTIRNGCGANSTGDTGFAPISDDAFDHIEGMVEIYEDRFPDPDLPRRLERKASLLSPSAHYEAGWRLNHLGVIYSRQGQIDLAIKCALKGLRCYRDERSDYAAIFQLIHLTLFSTVSGNLTAASGYCREADDLIQATQWTDRNLITIAAVASSEIRYLRGEVDLAVQSLDGSVEALADGEAWVELYQRLFSVLARGRLRLHGAAAAHAAIDSADEVAAERGLPRVKVAADILRAEILVRSGLFESANQMVEQLLQRQQNEQNRPLWTWREDCDLLLLRAQLLIALEQYQAALDMAEAARSLSQQVGSSYHGLKAVILATRASWSLEQHEAALAHLQSAVAIARPHETIQPFLDEGRPLAQVIIGVIRRFGLGVFSADAVGFLSRIATVNKQKRPAAVAGRKRAPIQEGLFSLRELEVLRELQQGASNKEIARALALSEATVKFHLKNIFGKLGVSRRGMAVVVSKRFFAP